MPDGSVSVVRRRLHLEGELAFGECVTIVVCLQQDPHVKPTAHDIANAMITLNAQPSTMDLDTTVTGGR